MRLHSIELKSIDIYAIDFIRENAGIGGRYVILLYIYICIWRDKLIILGRYSSTFVYLDSRSLKYNKKYTLNNSKYYVNCNNI